ncbi:MAG: FtsX-like permease family protein, partial [Rhodothermales bacterium]|nr:FtsX-like permease family protein [Rhodothermales bacterium]
MSSFPLESTMIRHYLRTAARTVTRHPGFSAINILGLSVGVAVAVLLFLFVHAEWTYDRFHDDSDRIYRTWLHEDWGPGQQFFNTVTPIRLGPSVLDEIPDIEDWVRYDRVTSTVTSGETTLNETVFMVDANFLDFFDFQVAEGDASTMLSGPGQIVLTESARERWFGGNPAIGRTLTLDMGGDPMEFEVSGILEDVPVRSSLQFEMLISYDVAPMIYSEGQVSAWFMVSPETYARLQPGADPLEVQRKVEPVVKSQMGEDQQQVDYTVGFQPITSIHLDTEFPVGYAAVNNPVYARVLFVIAWLILGTACINFVTLSISRSVERSREIGVRKAVGASRGELLRQYWGESLLYSAIALLVGVVGAELLLPGFNALTGQPVSLSPTPGVFALFAGILVALGLLAGLYPALVLSGFSPVDAIRGRSRTGRGASLTRRARVGALFTLSIILLAATFVATDLVRT